MSATAPIFIYKISNIHRKFLIFLSEELAPLGINPSAFPLLMALASYQKDGFLQDDFIKLTGITKSVATKVVQELEEKEYIVRTQSKHSKRHKLILPTQKIQKIQSTLEAITIKWNEIITESMPEEDIYLLSALLDTPFQNTMLYSSKKKRD